MSTQQEQNYYEILEVENNAPQHMIHEAYQKAKKTYSTDSPALYSMFTPEEAKALMRLIDEAFSVLGNQALRKSYDQKLLMNKNWESNEVQSSSAFHPDESPVEENSWGAETNSASPSPKPEVQNSQQDWSSSTDDDYNSLAASADHFHNPTHDTPDSTDGDSENQGRTPLSSYLIDETIEEEIRGQITFDGPFLQKIREYKNIPMGQLSDATRISRTYLQYVEANDYKSLPAPVFVRGFVIQIAKILGLDEKSVASSYMDLLKENLKK